MQFFVPVIRSLNLPHHTFNNDHCAIHNISLLGVIVKKPLYCILISPLTFDQRLLISETHLISVDFLEKKNVRFRTKIRVFIVLKLYLEGGKLSNEIFMRSRRTVEERNFVTNCRSP